MIFVCGNSFPFNALGHSPIQLKPPYRTPDSPLLWLLSLLLETAGGLCGFVCQPRDSLGVSFSHYPHSFKPVASIIHSDQKQPRKHFIWLTVRGYSLTRRKSRQQLKQLVTSHLQSGARETLGTHTSVCMLVSAFSPPCRVQVSLTTRAGLPT